VDLKYRKGVAACPGEGRGTRDVALSIADGQEGCSNWWGVA